MSQARILQLLGPAAVLYLIAEVVASGVEPDAAAVGLSVLALLLSTVPLYVLRRRDEQRPGERRVALLAALGGIALMRWARPELPSLYLDLVSAVALPALGVAVLQLGATIPDRPGPLSRSRRGSVVLLCLAALGSSAVAGLAAAPSFELLTHPVRVPPGWGHAGAAFAGLAAFAALSLRIVRRRLGSTPEALASGVWAQLGLVAALLAGGLAAGLVASQALPASSTLVRLLVGAVPAVLVAGHIAMLGHRRQPYAGRSARRLVAASVALAVVALGAAHLGDRLPRDAVASGVAAALVVAIAAIVQRLASAAGERLLSPSGGRLLRASDEALTAAVGAGSLEELGALVLPPLRRASGALDAEPFLVTLDPPRQVRIDAAGLAHVAEREPSPAIVTRLRLRPGEILVSAPLAEQVVRRADVRALVEALVGVDASAVVPLSRELELEGFLVVPRGRRRGAITLEELDSLERLGRHLSAQVSLLSAEERARRRTSEAVRAREVLEEELEAAHDELAKLRTGVRIVEADGAPAAETPLIAYSPAMRALTRRLEEVAPLDAPLLLAGEDGAALDQVGHFVHVSGGRREGPLVVADCAAVRPERAEAALFGESAEAQPGWLRLAEGGTCLLRDVPALSRQAQAKLADALATRRAHPADSPAAYPLDARVVATSRVPLARLVEAGAFDLDLYRRLERLVLEVPPLRDRREDLPSLLLLALDRSCRTAGRPVLGVEADALEVLVAHEWPGNLQELTSVIERAVGRASGPNVRLLDLPSLALSPVEEPEDPFCGTYAQIEARILEHAIARADGNKSEAARLLGLKRSTFFDKLKRNDLLGPEPKKSAHGSAA